MNLADQQEQNLKWGLRSVPCSGSRKCQGIFEIGDVLWNAQLNICVCDTRFECGPDRTRNL